MRLVSDAYSPTIDATSVGIQPDKVEALRDLIRTEVAEGTMPAVQFAVAFDGELALFESFGEATETTRFAVFSATKALIAGAVWQLMAEGALSTETRVIDILPGFGASGRTPEWMSQVTLEQLLTHTSGFPYAPLSHPRWADREGRLERYATWHAATEPGTTYTYHPLNAHWVVADMIEALEQADFREVIGGRIIEPTELRSFGLGVPEDPQDDIAELIVVGEPPSEKEVAAILGPDVDMSLLDSVSPAILAGFNMPEIREVGIPGGGGIATAADLAIFYQALLHNPGSLWDHRILADGTGTIRCALPDVMTGIPGNRSLGLVISGDDEYRSLRSMGGTVSPRAFGHNGAAGQIVWADPESGVSFALVTSGVDQNFLREAGRTLRLSGAAGELR